VVVALLTAVALIVAVVVIWTRVTAPAGRTVDAAPTGPRSTSEPVLPLSSSPVPHAAASAVRATASTPKPTPVPTPVARAAEQAKKGVAASAYSWKDPAKLAALGVSWAYNWSASVPASTSTIQYIPMVWGPALATPATLSKLAAGRKAGRYQTLLTFNEPEKTRQANMSPAQAIALWPALMATGLQLSSPAVASPNDGWLAQFMALAAQRHYRVDFIALHFYVDFTNPNAVSSLVATLRTVYARYQKPIWITELGALDTRPWGEAMAHLPSEGAAVSYLKQVTAALDGLPFVARYAWFSDNCWSLVHERTSSLYNGSGTMTDLGAAYTAAL
jgi:hypothetical protein